jgi:hypothetical protein
MLLCTASIAEGMAEQPRSHSSHVSASVYTEGLAGNVAV